jgi:hypothetical protein
MFRYPRYVAMAAILASLPALFLLAACGSGAKPEAKPSLSAVESATAPPAETPAGGQPDQAATPAPATPAPATPAAPPPGTPSAPVPTPTQLAVTDSAPCKNFQIKGDNSTHNFYLPGMGEYPGLRSNVQCFNTIDDAKGAGFHLPGQG